MDVNIVSLYASNCRNLRSKCWEELKNLQGNICIIGDFSMVTNINDRLNKKGACIYGAEKSCWYSLCHFHDLIDHSEHTGITWHNRQSNDNALGARLDRCYTNSSFGKGFWEISAVTNQSLFLSDHFPICLTFKRNFKPFRAGWPHLDARMLKFPSLINQIKEAISWHFSHNTSALKSWELVVKDIQKIFAFYKDKVFKARSLRKAKIMEALKLYDDKLRCEEYLEASWSLANSRRF
ncbi:hypothetical protein KP509_1Z248700 [Ceratopteris richardii]|nr:hypothetical protein KP509_1Z248700 [Ceratopteris richardii]